MFVLFCIFIVSVHSFGFGDLSWSKWMPPVYDETCHYTRQDALKCLMKYVDVSPRDGGITPHEVTLAIDKYSTPPIRALFWGWGSEQLFKKCDADHNGYITPKDWMTNTKDCMPHQRNLCSVQWFCQRAALSSHR